MISVASSSSTRKQSTPKVTSLLPPYAYEDLYSSYQNEWDQQQRKSNGKGNDSLTSDDLDIDESVSGLEWITLPDSHGDNKCDITYLLACTGSGEVIAWKLKQFTDSDNNNNNNIGMLERHSRCKISHDSVEAKEDSVGDYDDDECDGDGRESKSLHGICVLKVATNGGDDKSSSKHRHRKRHRPNKDGTETTNDGSSNEQQQQEFQLVLIVAGEGGLWSIPLLDLLQQPWEQPSPSATSSQQQPISSLLRLSNRPIQKIQCESETDEESSQCLLFALERDTNTLAIWNLSTILEMHVHQNSDEIHPAAPFKKIDLSRCFSNASTSSTLSKSKQRRKIRKGTGSNSERATTLFIIPSLTNGEDRNINSRLSLLVGTDRSRLWIIPIPNEDGGGDAVIHGPKARFFSLNGEGKSSFEDSPSQTDKLSLHQGGNRSAKAVTRPTVWRVSDILATNGGTWWTVAATTKSHTHKNNNNNNTGLIITWHALTGMVVARQETREAIQAILHHRQEKRTTLYSASNEGAISVWDSSFALKRRGRFWASPPSSKALAILSESGESCEENKNDVVASTMDEYSLFGISKNAMAVAGVGNKVDLFVDHCRVQTVQF